ncbi:hypothetical protein EGM97_05715 [Pseudomonas sp. AF32]|uniref:hypothetical protein n=1 Tax=Pseudomonas sp. AF32 TaxID=554390 RepID=UPI001EEE0422|nr:hypothetical protein [Pseudomonas sp. AF32]MCG6574200.1 hypothetical protein [Pseudomonas sp. AF32]
MNRFLRVMLLLKVMVMLSLGSTAAWAECDEHEKHAASGQVMQGGMLLATDDQKDTGDQDGDDSSVDRPDSEDSGDEEGDSQT